MFGHPAFLSATGRAFGHPVRLAAVERHDAWEAAAPLFEKRRGPFVAGALPHATPILSPLLRNAAAESEINQRRSALDVLISALDSEYDQLTFDLHQSLTDVRPFLWAGWSALPRYTQVADLSTEDPLATWSKSVHHTIRTESDRFEVVEGAEHAAACVDLMRAGYERKGKVFGLDGSTLSGLVHTLSKAGLARVFAAISDEGGTPEAVAVVATDGRTGHYWLAGSRPGPAMAVLLSSALPALKRSGVTSVDFTGANVPSVAEFKRKFGTDLRLRFRVRRLSHPVLRALGAIRRST